MAAVPRVLFGSRLVRGQYNTGSVFLPNSTPCNLVPSTIWSLDNVATISRICTLDGALRVITLKIHCMANLGGCQSLWHSVSVALCSTKG